MWKLLSLFLCIMLQVICERLVGDHICLTEERYSINVTEHYVRNVTVRNYRWCMNVPPRCSFYTIKKINETRIVAVPQVKTVEKCCPEFYEKDYQCISHCPNCKNGICRDRKCQCNPGYSGKVCDTRCEVGFWGSNCTKICDCEFKHCNPVNGGCISVSGDIKNQAIVDEEYDSTTMGSATTNIDYIQQVPSNVKGSVYQENSKFANDKSNTKATVQEKYDSTVMRSDLVHHIVEATTRLSSNMFATKYEEVTINIDDTQEVPSNVKGSINQENSKITTYKSNTIATVEEKYDSTVMRSDLVDHIVEATTRLSSITFATKDEEVAINIDDSQEVPSSVNGSINQENSYIASLNTSFQYDLPNTSTTKITMTTLNSFQVSSDLSRSDEQADLIFSPPPRSTLDVLDKTTEATLYKNKIEDKSNLENNFLINENKELLIPVEIKYDQIVNPLSEKDVKVTTSRAVYEGTTYLLVKDKMENENVLPSHDGYLINSVSVSAATTIALIILALIFLVVGHFRRGKKKDSIANRKNGGVSTVSVYTTSIFHTPLPELPTFDNPSYITPSEYQNYKEEAKAFETHIVCNMSSQNQTKSDFREYVYDHPPSTGSYRAASIVDPLDIDINQKVVHTEPVYDEIPCRGTYEEIAEKTPYDQSLYINTCGRTKF